MSATQTSYADAVKGISPKASPEPVSSPRPASPTTISSKDTLGPPTTAPPPPAPSYVAETAANHIITAEKANPIITAEKDIEESVVERNLATKEHHASPLALSPGLPDTPLSSISELIPAEEDIIVAATVKQKKKLGPKVVDVYHVYRSRKEDEIDVYRTQKEDEVDSITSAPCPPAPFPLPYVVEIELGYDYIRKDKNGRKALSRIREALMGGKDDDSNDIGNNIGITFDRSSTVALFRHARDAELFLALNGQVFDPSEGGWHNVPGMPADVWLKNGVTFQSQSGYRAVFDRLRGYGEIVQIIRKFEDRKVEEDEEDDEEGPSHWYSYSVFFRTKVASSAASREQGLRKCRYNEGVAIKRKPVDGVVQLEKKPRKKRKSGQSQHSAYSTDVTTILGQNDNEDISAESTAVSQPSFTIYEWLTISAIQYDVRPLYAWARPKITPSPVPKIDEPEWSWEALHPPPPS